MQNSKFQPQKIQRAVCIEQPIQRNPTHFSDIQFVYVEFKTRLLDMTVTIPHGIGRCERVKLVGISKQTFDLQEQNMARNGLREADLYVGSASGKQQF